ncbi:sensor histidine kinase [Sinosporangium siamense]|uniref:histidine kinase n=1 Tax=Sinosporangium siamense TaxID=1367973 RepID=A0A919RJF0_9ACTN|nr:HAMP domain-containing sensor histidine kinase [Sinosporangium siamense]GII94960.1 sensor protein CutS [Sinosporangium siamense]
MSRARPRRRLLRPTLRLRLTLVYGTLFVASGLVMIGATYLMVGARIPDLISFVQTAGPSGPMRISDPHLNIDKGLLSGPESTRVLARKQETARTDTANAVLTQGGIALVIVSAVAVGLGWLIAGRVLAPLHRVTDTARRIAMAADRSLHERIALTGVNDEVKELADTFDTMIQRLSHAFDGQRRFVANASHELRTPLTLSRALVEVAMHRRTASPDLVQLGETLMEINARHERLIDGLLLLARSENELGERAPVDLADVTTHVIAHAAAEAGKVSVTLYESPGEALTLGDPVLLERLVQNLVENGIRHNVRDQGFVRVVSRVLSEDQVEVRVDNSGPLIAPYDVPGLFEPFRRLNTDRLYTAKGVGLGLSIVRSVAAAHGGKVDAYPRPDGGLSVVVVLPRHHAMALEAE